MLRLALFYMTLKGICCYAAHYIVTILDIQIQCICLGKLFPLRVALAESTECCGPSVKDCGVKTWLQVFCRGPWVYQN